MNKNLQPDPLSAEVGVERSAHLAHLNAVVNARLTLLGKGAYGGLVEDTKALSASVETAQANVAQDDLAAGQTALEQSPRPNAFKDILRDTLAEMHQSEAGEPSSEQRVVALNGLLLRVSSEIHNSTHPQKGNLHYTDPRVQKLKGVESAFKQRYRNYFDDLQPEDEALKNGEQRTPHQVSDDAYETLLSYTEEKLKKPGLSPEKVEELRVARDTLHLERKMYRKEFDEQTEVIDSVMQMMGHDNNQFSETKLKEIVRVSVGDTLLRLKELVEIASQSPDSSEKFTILNDLQYGRAPIKSAEQYDDWKQHRADKAKLAEVRKSADAAEEARKSIEGIQGLPDTPRFMRLKPEGSTVNKPAVKEVKRAANNSQEKFLKMAISRVPERVINETLAAVAKDKLVAGQKVEVSALRKQLKHNMTQRLDIEPAKMEQLAKRIRQNGFHESAGGIWDVKSGPNSLQGRVAGDARKLVRELVDQLS